MHDKGKPRKPSDRDILSETLRSLQALIREVDETPADSGQAAADNRGDSPVLERGAPPPESAAFMEAEATPEPRTEPEPEAIAEPQIKPETEAIAEPKTAPNEKTAEPGVPRQTRMDLEATEAEPSPAVDWHSPTEMAEAENEPDMTEPEWEVDDLEDVPVLDQVAVIPARPAEAAPPAPGMPGALANLNATILAEITDDVIAILADALAERTGQQLDSTAQSHLQQEIYATLEQWAASTRERLRQGGN
jgi:hypothetical protein